MNIQNHLNQVRRKRGYSAAVLAAKTGVSRQTIYAMEARQLRTEYSGGVAHGARTGSARGTIVPARRCIAGRACDARRGHPGWRPGLGAWTAGAPLPCRQLTMGVLPSPVSWHLPAADAVVLDEGKATDPRRARVQLFQGEAELGNRLLMAGCDPAMSVLARRMQKADVELVLAHRNSSQSLELLREGSVHIAGSHLRDESTGESNLPQVRKLFPRGTAAVIAFAVWEEGIVVAKGNPKSLHEIGDFARKGITSGKSRAGIRQPASSRFQSQAPRDSLFQGHGLPSGRVRRPSGCLAGANWPG